MVRYYGRAIGRVQGVGFRLFVQIGARELGITGWVKNMSDGTVTMELQGEQSAIDLLTERIRRGNGFIRVDTLSLEPRTVEDDETDFRVRS